MGNGVVDLLVYQFDTAPIVGIIVVVERSHIPQHRRWLDFAVAAENNVEFGGARQWVGQYPDVGRGKDMVIMYNV